MRVCLQVADTPTLSHISTPTLSTTGQAYSLYAQPGKVSRARLAQIPLCALPRGSYQEVIANGCSLTRTKPVPAGHSDKGVFRVETAVVAVVVLVVLAAVVVAGAVVIVVVVGSVAVAGAVVIVVVGSVAVAGAVIVVVG